MLVELQDAAAAFNRSPKPLGKFTPKLSRDRAIPLRDMHAKELKTDTQTDSFARMFISSVVHSSQDVEKIHMSINEYVDKQNVLHSYGGILFSIKRNKELIYATTRMNCRNRLRKRSWIQRLYGP